MQFKIKNTEVKISFSFFALVLLFLTLDSDRNFLLILAFALLHELVHILFITLLSSAPKKVNFTLFGADILRDNSSNINYNSEIIINASAPIFNLIVWFLCFNNPELTEIAEINLVLGVFNLLPFYNFDGGNALNNLLLKYLSVNVAEKLMTVVSVLVTVAFSFLTIVIFVEFKHNFSLMFISAYMIFCIIFKK